MLSFPMLDKVDALLYNKPVQTSPIRRYKMICIKCGKEIDNDSVFCTACGARIKEPDTLVLGE